MHRRSPLPLALSLPFASLGSPLASGQGFDPPEAVDLDPDPTVVEVNLEASVVQWQFIPGVDTTVYAYNGSVPGPTIRVNVGDLLKVHFTNNLPGPTTIHWHGIKIPADQDTPGNNWRQRIPCPMRKDTIRVPARPGRGR